jgi:predicted dehydrogenase/nucleoside-diphosphate-sugar epimerase
LRVAVVGCGAIAQQMHLPILAGHEDVQLAALVDRDLARARQLANAYRVDCVLGDAVELTKDQIDAVVLATPPGHHAAGSIALIERGIHVLVEKPMATSYRDALAMVRAAEQAGVVLSVGFYRRLMPSMRMLKALLDSRWLGRPLRFEVASGGFYSWAAATLGNMRKELAGGGVLIDFGSHLLDLLHYLFDGPAELLEYRDNALGGIESDCRLQLRLTHQGHDVRGRVELSRTRKLGNLFRIECEGGTLEYRITERYRIWVTPGGLDLTDPLRGEARPLALEAAWADEPETEWHETLRHEIDDWLAAIRTGRAPALSGPSALPTVKLIDDCYHNALQLDEPWVWQGVRRAESAAPAVAAAANGRPRRVLITGATGFIGCRLAEILTLGKGWQVRALVHNPANASRLARLPVDMVQGDLRSPADMERAIADCDAVVHGAIGTEYGNARAVRAVTVGGISNLLAVAGRTRLERFVHLSSIGIHDPALAGAIDEATPVAPAAGDVYGRTKAEAERAVLKAARQGLPAVVLRPGCVYGPYGHTFVVNPLRALSEGRLVLRGSADSPANTVYVDNLVEAIVRALEAPAAAVCGEVFSISDGDTSTWSDYYGYFAEQLGLPLRTEPASLPARRRGWQPWRWPAAWLRGVRDIVLSAEVKALIKKVLNTEPIGRLPRLVLEGTPGLERWLRRCFGADRPPIYRRPGLARAGEPMVITGRKGCVRIDKARKVLGYAPVVAPPRALELTWQWARHAGLVV